MASSNLNNGNGHINPRQQDKNESIEQYIEYFKTLAEFNQWTDERTAMAFRTIISYKSDVRSTIDALDNDGKKSFVTIVAAILNERKPLRDTKVQEFFTIIRKNAKRIRSAAKLMFENVVPMIGGQIADPDDCGELIISCTNDDEIRSSIRVKCIIMSLEDSSKSVLYRQSLALKQ
ncbi:hypothetical protein BLOT_012316 [Blomia tropicalis]|nr:hypothetical protein BLOT_012316 [Blomia tropicalis]